MTDKDTHKTSTSGPLLPATSLTPEQIKNWRNILVGIIGPYALIMPDADVQRRRDTIQEIINSKNEN